MKRTCMITMILCIFLIACGSDSVGDDQMVQEPVSHKIYTPSTIFSEEDTRIWYEVKGSPIGKDSLVSAVYISQNGYIYVYHTDKRYYWEFKYDDDFQWRLGDFSKMTDEEIIEDIRTLLEFDDEQLNEILSTEMERCDYILKHLPGSFSYQFVPWGGSPRNYDVVITSIHKAVGEYLGQLRQFFYISPIGKPEYIIYTDSTGNATDKEIIMFDYTYPELRVSYVDSLYENLDSLKDGSNEKYDGFKGFFMNIWGGTFVEESWELSGNNFYYNGTIDMGENVPHIGYMYYEHDFTTKEPINWDIVVYDSKYKGYQGDDGRVLITRVYGDDEIFILDSVKSEGVIVDPDY